MRALEILHFLDERDKAQAKYDQFRSSLTATGTYTPEGLWPEYADLFTQTVDQDDPAALDPEASYDYSAVEWKGGSDAQQEYEELMRQISSLSQGSMNGDQLLAHTNEWR